MGANVTHYSPPLPRYLFGRATQDAASPRYIFTALQKAARAVFHPDDDPLLNYLDDDGLSIEPEFYVPVIPLILVNGSDGIGTGWSSQVRRRFSALGRSKEDGLVP